MQTSAVEIRFPLHAAGRQTGRNEQLDVAASGHGRVPRVTQVLALAIQFQDMIQRGEARDYADLARLGCLSRERMSQIMELIWLAPDIQQEILDFRPTIAQRFPISEVAVRRVSNSLCWSDQKSMWNRLKDRCL